jgi:hypothetical protein
LRTFAVGLRTFAHPLQSEQCYPTPHQQAESCKKRGLHMTNSATAQTMPTLTALELERHVSPRDAAEIKGISEDTFRRHYGHIIEKMSPRRDGVKLRKLLTAEPRSAV